MTNVELYINNQLCDTQNPTQLGIRLNRVFINPAELTSKDAQYSFSMELPSTPQNDSVFGYINVEEVGNKFSCDYNARLIVDNVTIFDGKFRMSEVSPTAYKGNLVIPVQKTVKEFFGDKTMSQIEGEWNLDLKGKEDIPAFINHFNTLKGQPACIFPYALYGLMPKMPTYSTPKEGEKPIATYSDKNVWDDTVRIGLEDMPPSINCMQAIKKIIESIKDENGDPYKIGGTAFDDDALANLYMSYKNPANYKQPWNWGHLGKMRIKGSWKNAEIKDIKYEMGIKKVTLNDFESNFIRSNNEYGAFYVADILKGKMCKLDLTQSFDNGTNILQYEQLDHLKNPYTQTSITIPISGLYKVKLSADIKLDTQIGLKISELRRGVKFVSGLYGSENSNYFIKREYEIKLLRDFGESIDLNQQHIDAGFYKNNINQDETWNTARKSEYHFPLPGNKSVMLIDPKVNQNLIGGFKWGKGEGKPQNPTLQVDQYKHLEEQGYILSIRNGWSWDVTHSQKDKIFSAIDCPAYASWTRDFDTNNSDEEIPWAWISQPKKFKVSLLGHDEKNRITRKGYTEGSGILHQVIWLNKGERISLVSVSNVGWQLDGGNGWMMHDINFDLEIEPFQTKVEWIKVDNEGTGIELSTGTTEEIEASKMNWKDASDFETNKINLFHFLPSEDKVDDWLDGFCKTFNLDLSRVDKNSFELNARQVQGHNAHTLFDISDKVNLVHRNNLPLNLPAIFELGFTVNKEEKGYIDTTDEGNGRLETGYIEGKTLKQVSKFSYNWMKEITKGNAKMYFPIISHNEVWELENNIDKKNYAEMQQKMYTHYGQRFWFRTVGNPTYNLQAVFYKGRIRNEKGNGAIYSKDQPLLTPQLSNTYQGQKTMQLSYRDDANTILSNFFKVIASTASHYTEVECLLTPTEYELLSGNALVMFNSDVYYLAAIDSYDPVGIGKTKLKLIKRA